MDLLPDKRLRLNWGKKMAGLALVLLPVQTYQDVLMRHVPHPEAKSAGLDGLPCGPATTGELSRLQVYVDGVTHIGKESHELEEVQARLVSPQSAYVHYVDEKTEWCIALERLRKIPASVLVKRTGLSRSQIYRILKGECYPRSRIRVLLTKLTPDLARVSGFQMVAATNG